MANTYTQLNTQIVFAVQGRENIITKGFKEELNRYIYGILKNEGHFPLAINGSSDHIHLFFEQLPTKSTSDLARIVKTNSSKWINENHFVVGHFHWQEGFGAFSYSRSQRDEVIKYIIMQEEHHKKQSFKTEYLEFLKKFNIQFDEQYLFDWLE